MNLRPNAVKYLALSLFGVLGISSSAHAQFIAPEISFDPTLSFILTTDMFPQHLLRRTDDFRGGFPGGPRDTTVTENDFNRSGYYNRLPYAGIIEFKAEKDLNSLGRERKFTINALYGGTHMEITVNLWDNTQTQPLDSLTCRLSEKHTHSSRELDLLTFRGECDGRVVTFTLAVKRKTRADMEQKACIDEGVRLATALDSTKKRAEAAEKWTAEKILSTARTHRDEVNKLSADCERLLTEKNGAITLAQTNLATARTERDQARASLQTLTTNLKTSVLPYLKRVVETLKDPNNYYRALRNDAKGVLDSTSK